MFNGRYIIAITALAAVSIAFMAEADRSAPLTPYQLSLRSQVDAVNGAPQSGRNPAAQVQTSLTAAASAPVGNGLRTETPASDVKVTQRQVKPSDVLPDPHVTGRYFNGCIIGYALPGQTCVVDPMKQSIDCRYSRALTCVLGDLSLEKDPKKKK